VLKVIIHSIKLQQFTKKFKKIQKINFKVIVDEP